MNPTTDGAPVSTVYELPAPAPRTLHIANLDAHEYKEGEHPERTRDISAANIVSSIDGGHVPGSSARHWPVLDLDIPAVLVPSSTPGHSHLYVDVAVPDGIFWDLCDALAAAGILQPGYVSACKSRGFTSVRLPWVRKAADHV